MMSDVEQVLTDVLAKHDVYDAFNDEACTVAGLMRGLERFSDEPLIEAVEGNHYASSALVVSESGDRFLVLVSGVWTARMIALDTFVCAPVWWGGFGDMNIVELKVIEV